MNYANFCARMRAFIKELNFFLNIIPTHKKLFYPPYPTSTSSLLPFLPLLPLLPLLSLLLLLPFQSHNLLNPPNSPTKALGNPHGLSYMFPTNP